MSEDETEHPNHAGREAMKAAVAERKRREEQWQKEGERTIRQNLSMIGSLGWLIVVPMLLGAALGRWLDGLLETNVFFSGSLIFLGACLGGYMVWKRMNER